ncbi:ethanolamine utilization protein EutH [Staphylococcus gallinarum]|uniref:ethanolamine utilization protein EutH n=1 Tax=Staphylococcus gallinarum TaxID=1293 RepID=UPI000D1C6232|nr:ethanolamine utilization protein EutH [Staphylococcus gallinarum]MBU7218257.1 ethanolamine utilization protein EutH [Staphylococcus gallinarum]MCD8828822.1 ethanolamine utilization protein EutH [Staphylococcus gallinarum]MCD8844723.1 ethanolamine utilization protein EutH [Staphylococcus gallinarum]MCD8902732.1 ethanolamine utilization protein EutH [Staphylococcus gallinarum]MEB6055567.1 ethanolamine utilization protein EutH [Staphylococcus gallinarum]
MEHIGTVIIYIIMICAVLGAIGAIKDAQRGIGKEFMEGIYTIGPIFANSAGIMASIPFISQFIEHVFGPMFDKIGADPAIAATSILATDMGGYQLADVLKESYEGWIMAMIVGFMAGATIVFTIPLGLPMLEKRDHKYMALGILSGLLAIPFGAFVSTTIMLFSHMKVRTFIGTTGAATHVFSISFTSVLLNLLPLIIFVVITAIGLYFFSDLMIKLFIIFGKILDTCIKLVFVCSVVEIFTGFFTHVFGVWGFDPIMADKEDNFRALENAGNIAIMLSGAFPMVYLIRKYFSNGLTRVGGKIGLSEAGSAGIIATIANILAMFKLVKDMPPKDKVINISFGVSSAFLLGDHLSYTANFQPTLIPAVLIGKLSAGILSIIFAYILCLPKARKLERIDRQAGIIGLDEYKNE